MGNILDDVKNSISVYQDASPEDVCIIICDTEKIYAYKPGKEIDLKVEIGKSMKHYEKSAAAQVLKTGQRIRKEVGAEFLGIPYIVTASPIYEDGKLVGSISSATSNKKLDTLRTISQELSHAVESMSESSELIARASNEVASYVQELSSESELMTGDIQKINSVLEVIEKNALQAKILGLNASIEAARAGEAGKGFAVVSNEIQKMGKQSEESSKNIGNQLTHVHKVIDNLNDSIQKIAGNTQQHASSVQELKATFESIEVMTQRLVDVAKK